MSSMRRLKQRLARWQRYDARIARLVPTLVDRGLRNGHYRAARAVAEEQNRRFWDETPEIWLGGPAGEAALIADVLDDDGGWNWKRTADGGWYSGPGSP